ncbi:MAG: helix-turn-helix domain-containing protein [Lachnospiraceae bacterium]|nr:helix-turn-helix domain-containing protein [Lachnospiraceae bacterium]
MNMKIGAKLAELRRKKGLTQEQLAEKLGISAPAISKWETDNSYPDIALLCPLARALGTNVDTILQFEENLTDESVIEKINTVIEITRRDGYEAGEKMIFELLRKYPNSITLKFNAAIIWDTFQLFFPAANEETRKNWTANKVKLLTEVRDSGTSVYWQTATLQLASIAVTENRLEQAEQLLKELPEHIVDPTIAWSNLYLKKDEPVEALKTVQKRLFLLVRQVQTCLTVMLDPKVIPDNEQALQICEVYKAVDNLFGCGGMYDGLFIEIYFRMNRLDEAANCLERYVDVLMGEAVLPKRFLFSPGVDIKEKQPASSKEFREILIKGLEDERYHSLLQYPKCKIAIEKLKSSI